MSDFTCVIFTAGRMGTGTPCCYTTSAPGPWEPSAGRSAATGVRALPGGAATVTADGTAAALVTSPITVLNATAAVDVASALASGGRAADSVLVATVAGRGWIRSGGRVTPA